MLSDKMENEIGEAINAFKKEKKIKSLFWIGAISLAVIYFIIYLSVILISRDDSLKEIVYLDFKGVIAEGKDASARKFIPLLEEAFKNEDVKKIVIVANSPGGSPSQSEQIYSAIELFKNKYKKPIVSVVEDMCASGCYYAMSATDKIYVNPNSLVGSIGVRMDVFGFTELMKKLGVENRSMHAGKHKLFLDPFSPKDEEGRKVFKKEVLEKVHQVFIKRVKKYRKKLKGDESLIFSGMIWAGDGAIKIGLADDIATPTTLLYKWNKTWDDVSYLKPRKPLLKALLGADFHVNLNTFLDGQKVGINASAY